MKQHPFSRSERISLEKEVEKLLTFGKRVSKAPFILVWREQDKGKAFPDHRFAVKLRRGFESAVARNRVKRLLREAYRREKHNLAGSTDLIMIVQSFKVGKDLGFDKVREQFVLLCKEAGLWKDS